MKTVEVSSRAEWRKWLVANHDRETEVWLVYYKKAIGIPCVEYNASVEEALCFGWVDSIIKKLDDTRYVRKFTPRRESSRWSPSNIKRVEKMIEAGLMTEHGMRLVEAARQSGSWDNPAQRPDLDFEMPAELALALRQNRKAARAFEALSPSHQKQYIVWIATAKRQETRERRAGEAIRLLEEGQELGLK